jgi:hypothetical protein
MSSDNSTDTTEVAPPEEVKACVQGQVFGYATFVTPNMTSKAYVGNSFNISWKFTPNVKKLPDYVDLKLQMLASKVEVDWNTVIASQVPTIPMYYIWTPKNALDGSYKLRLVPNGKETFILPSEQLSKKQPCFEAGEAVPSVSSSFRLINPISAIDDGTGSSSTYGPSNGGVTLSQSLPTLPLALVLWCVLILCKKYI